MSRKEVLTIGCDMSECTNWIDYTTDIPCEEKDKNEKVKQYLQDSFWGRLNNNGLWRDICPDCVRSLSFGK